MTLPTLKDFKEQAPQAICHINVGNVPRTMLINLHKPPFDNPELRRAMVLSLDRKAFNQIINEGVRPCDRRRNMLPAPERRLGRAAGCPAPRCPVTGPMWRRTGQRPARSWRNSATVPTTGSSIKVSTRNFPAWRDPAVVLISQLREIYIDAELDLVDTAVWYPKMSKKDFTVGAVPIESGVDDPDQMFYENYYSGAARNYAGYSDPETDKLIDQQSMTADPKKRKEIVWEIERRLAEAYFRPVTFYPAAAGCFQPWVKGFTPMTNSIYNGWRMEDVWLDK